MFSEEAKDKSVAEKHIATSIQVPSIEKRNKPAVCSTGVTGSVLAALPDRTAGPSVDSRGGI